MPTTTIRDADLVREIVNQVSVERATERAGRRAPPDRAALVEAIARLRHAQQPGAQPGDRVRDGVQAGWRLGQITSADVSGARREGFLR